MILMGYLNPIMQFGFERFCQRCVEVGIDGVIIPDLPFKDYLEEYKPVADKYDIRIIMLITPKRAMSASALSTSTQTVSSTWFPLHPLQVHKRSLATRSKPTSHASTP